MPRELQKKRVRRNGGGLQRRLLLRNCRSVLTPSLLRHLPNLRTPVLAYVYYTGEHLYVCARARSRLRARFTSAPVVTSDLFSRPSRVFQEPKTLPEYTHFKPSTHLNP